MSGNIYTAQTQDVAATVVQDLVELLAPSDAVLEILALIFFQTSDVGDAAEELLLTTIRRVTGAPTSGSGGTTPTPVPMNGGAVASGATIEMNNTTQLSGGTNSVAEPFGINVRIPEKQVWIPEGRLYISPSTRLVWELEDTPADSLTISCAVKWREIGG